MDEGFHPPSLQEGIAAVLRTPGGGLPWHAAAMDPVAAILALCGLFLAVWVGYVLAGARRTPGPGTDPAAFDRLQETLERVARAQEQLRLETQRGREDALVGLAGAAQDLQGRLAQAQRSLAEVKALEQARGSQLDRAADSLRRLELVVAGSGSRGAAGENVLARALAQLPPDLLETNAAFGGRVVEYALRLPGGRLLPIDSKWTGAAELQRLETTDDPAERRRLREQVAREIRLRAREMAKYLDPERTLALAVLAVPDAVHAETPETHAEGWREGVLVVPYSLALPFVLSLYRLTVRFASAPDMEEIASRVARLSELLQRMDDEVESRLSRALVQAGNARDALRGDLAEARRSSARLAGFDRPRAEG
jgi:DNA recombination protein RmuC